MLATAFRQVCRADAVPRFTQYEIFDDAVFQGVVADYRQAAAGRQAI
jgi:hypothetical protein